MTIEDLIKDVSPFASKEESKLGRQNIFRRDLAKYISNAKTKNELRDMSEEFGWNYGTPPTKTYDAHTKYSHTIDCMCEYDKYSFDEMKEYILGALPPIYIIR